MAKFLLDTNILIPVEDARATPEAYASLLRELQERNHEVWVHEANLDDIRRDQNVSRKAISLSKAGKYPRLEHSWRDADQLARDFGQIKSPNDLSDAHLLSAVSDRLVDILVTEDNGLHLRAARVGLGDRVLTVRQTLDFIIGAYARVDYVLKSVARRYCYQLDPADPIFVSLQGDYDGFDAWMATCRERRRECWVVEDDRSIAALVIFKEESAQESPPNVHGRTLKLCTFKVSETYRGGRLGEQLLRQAMWAAYDEGYDSTYLTVFRKQSALRSLIFQYGFRRVGKNARGELIYAKGWDRDRALTASDIATTRSNYPHWPSNFPEAQVIPVKPHWHDRLFPEAASRLAHMPGDLFSSVWAHGTPERSSPSNSLRKVYLGYTPTVRVEPGAIIAFYRSADNKLGVRSAVAAIGIAERFDEVVDYDHAISLTAKRTVYTNDDLEILVARGGLKALTFLFYGYMDIPITSDVLIQQGILNGPPQSFVRLADQRLEKLAYLVSGHIQAA